ncbi:MAG: fibronectin type III domain-containing protein, partial [Chloroflexi bacterium]|nr:fibronectin type III domain-containing protein [Chloroflexota bacterium]
MGGLTASNSTATTIDLAWALPTQPAGVTVTGLEVQQQSDNAWTTVASLGADATSHTVTDLTEGTTYTFRIRLAANNGTADSETVSETALASPKPATDLAASNPSRTGIDLSWTLPAQSLGVTVSAVEVQYRYATSKGLGYNDWAWGTLVTLAADATSHTVTQVTPGTNYAFRIRLATNNGHADSESVAAAALEPPKPATGLSISNVTGTTVDLSWTFPAQPEGVVVTAVEVHSGGLIKPGDESVPDFKAYGQVELAGDATSIALPVLHGGFTHRFRVRLVTN